MIQQKTTPRSQNTSYFNDKVMLEGRSSQNAATRALQTHMDKCLAQAGFLIIQMASTSGN